MNHAKFISYANAPSARLAMPDLFNKLWGRLSKEKLLKLCQGRLVQNLLKQLDSWEDMFWACSSFAKEHHLPAVIAKTESPFFFFVSTVIHGKVDMTHLLLCLQKFKRCTSHEVTRILECFGIWVWLGSEI